MQAKLTAKSKQRLLQKIRALQTTKNAFHVGFEEWKGSLPAFS